ncbi:DNA segregation ATPase FtsK/SpoIIIE, S-DNA-T family [Paenibacillus catalpae]|uniref:DNA segregation ATPase FtsK/SpoIIIE, S-DNA-T family n=1 Tax=Paenibacillus catalpae TaxID=1045775 RepID=A0A1I1UFV3_9BACL|nr:DNA translocase FtsK [Paenibacillus catalpae]SFD69597.1 DNA segregation ATPase FtsK/SpoIIIE, S-DNA-T family [Paenibacillus catalpae]
MAKKRRKKKSIATQLKYEVYGILLITVSVIALSGEATVGRSLSKLFGLFLGKFYFVLALVGIYVGLVVMVKRAWPRGWTNRRTGLLVFVLALTLSSSIAEIDRKLLPTADLTGRAILHQLTTDMSDELLTFNGTDDRPISQRAISGGYIGAIEYSMLFSLFGYFGSKLIAGVMYAISIMLLTGKSYVELARIGRDKTIRLYKLLSAKWSKGASLRSAAKAKSSKAVQPPVFVQSDAIDDDDDDDYAAALPPRRKKSLFFSWRNQEQSSEQEPQSAQDDWSMNEEHYHGGHDNSVKPHWANTPDWDDEWDRNGEVGSVAKQQGDELPPWEQQPERENMAPVYPAYNELEEDEEPAVITRIVPRADTYEDEAQDDYVTLPADPARYGEEYDEIDPEPAMAVDLNSEDFTEENTKEKAEAATTPVHQPASDVPVKKPYLLPPFSLLAKPSLMARGGDGADAMDSKRKLEATLESFGVKAKVLDVVRGPAVTRYEVQPASGVKVSRIVSLTDDIALALAAKDIRMEAPIPGKSAIGIEVPNMEVSMVTMREVMETTTFHNAPSKLSIAFGRDISGQPIIGNLARMPHLLVAGATGSGKSVCINGIITSILYKAAPDEVKFLMVDPKMVELNVYNGIPHLLAPVVTDPRRAALALKKIVVEMEKRYELFSKSATRNIEGYNALMAENPKAVLPYIVVIVDELADLMMVASNDVEDSIARLAQMARAAGIHLIIATQRPSVDVITGVIKANIPSRIAFGVSSQVDSRTILDMVGAEKLLGRGDMLYLPVGMSKPIRVQGAFLSDQEVEALVEYARGQAEAEYKEDLVPEVEEESADPEEIVDELYDQAVQIVLEAKQASVSLLQRRMRVGYTRAARLVDQMEARGIVGPYEGSKPREVLMSMEQYQASRIPS